MNGLKFDSHSEEKAVELFSKNIIKAGEDFYLKMLHLYQLGVELKVLYLIF